jgi:hypothetical protein
MKLLTPKGKQAKSTDETKGLFLIMSKNPILCFKIKYFLLPHKYNFYGFYFEKRRISQYLCN